jgi:2-(1,2-epoxy-1,2-dihydrophenyl)acetyl-CoA isomerase
VSVDRSGNGPRLKIEDQKTGRVGFLDALELETLAWLPGGALHPFLDPSWHRWRDRAPQDRSIAGLVRRKYEALARGDGETLDELLDPDFEGHLADGMPLGIGGPHRGAEAMREQGWWAIGRAFDVHAEPEEWLACHDGRLLVRGRYAGRARESGAPLEAEFAHLWAAREGRLTSLWQLTDTAAWVEALA